MVIDTKIIVTILKSTFRFFLFLIISTTPTGTRKINIGIAATPKKKTVFFIPFARKFWIFAESALPYNGSPTSGIPCT